MMARVGCPHRDYFRIRELFSKEFDQALLTKQGQPAKAMQRTRISALRKALILSDFRRTSVKRGNFFCRPNLEQMLQHRA
jgi:hypothetical protein